MIKYDSNINNIKLTRFHKGGHIMDLSNKLDKLIDTLKSRVEREIPDKGYFRNFAERIETDKETEIYGKNIALFIERDEEREGRAFLGISLLHPQIRIDATSYLINGDRDTILKYLKEPQLHKKLEEKIYKLSESLKDVR